MVSSGEATLIARAAAWMGRGRAVSAPTQINTTPNGSELPFVRLAFWTRQHPSLQPHSQTSSCPTPSHPTAIPDLSQVAPHLSCSECEKEQSSPLPTPSGGSLGPKLCHTNVALPSCAPPIPLPGHSGSLVAENQRRTATPPGLPHTSESKVLPRLPLRSRGWELGTRRWGGPAGAPAGNQSWGRLEEKQSQDKGKKWHVGVGEVWGPGPRTQAFGRAWAL